MTIQEQVMDLSEGIPKGIWYEKKRRRWRVKLVFEGVLLHRSYHKEYADALAAWVKTKKSMVRPRPLIPIPESSLINRYLCQPLVRE